MIWPKDIQQKEMVHIFCTFNEIMHKAINDFARIVYDDCINVHTVEILPSMAMRFYVENSNLTAKEIENILNESTEYPDAFKYLEVKQINYMKSKKSIQI